MLCRWERLGVLAALLMIGAPGFSRAQADGQGLIVQFAAEAEEEDDDEVEVSQEVTVEIEQDGKTVTVTQTVEGEFVGEIVDGDETTPIRAKSLDELKEKSAEAHAAFTAKPAAAAKQDVTTQTITENNGDRRIEVQTPGRKFVSKDQRGNDLEITVKQDLEHGTRTERYEAEDVASLQKKFPKIAKEFQTHAAGAGGINVQLPGGVRFGMNPQAPGPRKFTGEHQGRQVTIKDEQGRNIRITIAGTEDGKETKEEFEADDLPSLKKEHPEIARIYEKFAGKGFPQPQQPFGFIGGNVQIQIRNQAAAPPVPVPQAAAPAQPLQPVQQLQIVRQSLERSRQRLEKIANADKTPDAETLKQLAEDLAEITKKLEALEGKK